MRRLMTGLFCIGLFVADVTSVMPIWAQEPTTEERTETLSGNDMPNADDVQDGTDAQNPDGGKDGDNTQNPEEGKGGDDAQNPDGGKDGDDVQNPEEGKDGDNTQNSDEGDSDGEGEGNGNDAQNPEEESARSEEPVEPEETARQAASVSMWEKNAKMAGSDGVFYDDVLYLSAKNVMAMDERLQARYRRLCDEIAAAKNSGVEIENAVFAMDADGNLHCSYSVSMSGSDVIGAEMIDGLEETPALDLENGEKDILPPVTGSENKDDISLEEGKDTAENKEETSTEAGEGAAGEFTVFEENMEKLFRPEAQTFEVVEPVRITDVDLGYNGFDAGGIQAYSLLPSEDYFRDQLTDTQKAIYDAAKETLTKGTTLFEVTVQEPDEISWDDAMHAVSALMLAYPAETDWMRYCPGRQYGMHDVYDPSGLRHKVAINFGKSDFYSSSLEQRAQEKVKEVGRLAVQYAVKNYPNASAYGVVRYLDQWVCENGYFANDKGGEDAFKKIVEAGDNADPALREAYYNCHTAYGILLEGYGVCEGYAKTMSRLLDAVGIPNLFIVGDVPEGGHAWNYVQMPNGNWYLLDSTFNDESGPPSHKTSTQKYLLVKNNGRYVPDGNILHEDKPTKFIFPPLADRNYDPQKESSASWERVEVTKKKTLYGCGEEITLDDLTVTYYGADGTARKLMLKDGESDGYTTNAASLSTAQPGILELVVTYEKDGKTLTGKVRLNVVCILSADNTTITLPAEGDYDYTYNGRLKEPKPLTVSCTLGTDGGAGSPVTLVEGTDYTVSYENNINAGGTQDMAAPTLIIEGTGNYGGSVEKTFAIHKAAAPGAETLTATAPQCTQAQEGRTVDLTDSFKACGEKTGYEVIGVEDAKSIFSKTPGTTDIMEGIFTYGTKAAQVGDTVSIKIKVSFRNYKDAELAVKIAMAEERVAYTVTLDGMGHCAAVTKNGIKAGTLLELTQEERTPEPDGSGWVFAGWYKDKSFAKGKAWNFDTDTVQSDLTLYACWLAAAEEGSALKLCVQEIPDLYYTGSAQKPSVTVYDSDGTTLLKLGKDYTVKYVNNTNAVAVDENGQPKKTGGTAKVVNPGKKNETTTDVDGFTKDCPYVVITGKGNYAETIYRNFLILPAGINADGGTASQNPAGQAADTPLAQGFTLKYTDQLVVNRTKDQKPFGSMKYKKGMKAGTDFTVMIGAAAGGAFSEEKELLAADWKKEGTLNAKKQYTLPVIPKGYSGAFIMTVTGKGNYAGTVTRKLYVSDKQKLMKNASITLGRNQKKLSYTGKDVTLTPGYHDAGTGKYHKVTMPGMVSGGQEANANDMFLVKAGKNGRAGGESLIWGRDYIIDYAGTNRAAGRATMTLTGINGYVGSKSVTFQITGTAFNAKTVDVKVYNDTKTSDPQADAFRGKMPYTGSALTQNKVRLTTKVTKQNPTAQELVYGEHYTVSYKNNVKKGRATMTFTALPASGYSGSFSKRFDITAQGLSKDRLTIEGQEKDMNAPDERVGTEAAGRAEMTPQAVYSKNGAKLSFTVTNEAGTALREGTDYTVKYKNNTAVTTAQTADSKKPLMTVTGKGNYAGRVEVPFTIVQSSLADAVSQGSVSVACTRVQKKNGMKYRDFKFKLVEGKKTLVLGENKDYVINETGCTPQIIQAFADALAAGTALPTEPVVKVTGRGGYAQGGEIEIPLGGYIYADKLTAACVYAVVSEGTGQSVYTGSQVTPDVAVYYGEKKAVDAAKKKKETSEEELTKPKAQGGLYGLERLTERKETDVGDYSISYGTNIAAGKNKGNVTIIGVGRYGGNVTVKFTIGKKPIY